MSKAKFTLSSSELEKSSDLENQSEASLADKATTKTDGQAQCQHPHQWSLWNKYVTMAVMSFGEMIVPSASMMLAPALPQVMDTFDLAGQDEKLSSFSVTVYMIGMAVGMLVFGPMSDLYGRAVPARVAAYGYTIASVLCALSRNIGWLIAARAIAGIFGAAPVVIGGSLVADLFEADQRDVAMTLYVAGPTLGPVIGSIVGGLINEAIGWRWILWVTSIMSAVYALLCTIWLRETHYPSLERQLASKNRAHCASAGDPGDKTVRRRLSATLSAIYKTVTVPARIALLPAISLLMIFFIAYSGFFNILISSLGTVYQRYYDFPESTAGFGYIAIGTGVILGLLFSTGITKLLVQLLPTGSKGKQHKNYLLTLVMSACLICVGWILYGWASDQQLHWAVSMVGLLFYGAAGAAIKTSANLFLVEVVSGWSSSTLAAVATTNSIGAAVIPLATFPMYEAVGIGWSYTIMSLTVLLLCSLPLGLFVSAESLTGRWDITQQLD